MGCFKPVSFRIMGYSVTDNTLTEEIKDRSKWKYSVFIAQTILNCYQNLPKFIYGFNPTPTKVQLGFSLFEKLNS